MILNIGKYDVICAVLSFSCFICIYIYPETGYEQQSTIYIFFKSIKPLGDSKWKLCIVLYKDILQFHTQVMLLLFLTWSHCNLMKKHIGTEISSPVINVIRDISKERCCVEVDCESFLEEFSFEVGKFLAEWEWGRLSQQRNTRKETTFCLWDHLNFLTY